MDKADFLARFNVLFTNYMRLRLPKARRCSRPLNYGMYHGETATPSWQTVSKLGPQ